MTIEQLDHKRVCILGFGREGQATLKALKTYAPNATITIADGRDTLDVEDETVQLKLGDNHLKNLEEFDVIIKSPGIPPKPGFEKLREKLSSSTQIFLDTVQEKGSVVIGITGSKGKTTTSSLLYEILKAAKRDVHLVGNIGIPAMDYLNMAKKNTIFVQEMSSYQLMNLTSSPHIAVITSFFPEHLNYHGSLKNYFEAKAHIARFQTSEDIVFFNARSEECVALAAEGNGGKIHFSIEDAPVKLSEMKLLGQHNLSNSAAAYKVASELGVSTDTAKKAICNFEGVPHRLQSLGIKHGIEWVNDAISTTPESTMAGLEALKKRVHTLILGGQDRGNDFTELAQDITEKEYISTIILLPDSGARIREALEKNGCTATLYNATSIEEVVNIAKEQTNTSVDHTPICLLSPASPSYNQFKNFEEKGEMFKSCIFK